MNASLSGTTFTRFHWFFGVPGVVAAVAFWFVPSARAASRDAAPAAAGAGAQR